MRRRSRTHWIWIVVVILIACASRNQLKSSPSTAHSKKHPTSAAAPTATEPIPSTTAPATPVSFFMTPSPEGLKPVADAIASAHTSIKMFMFHLSEKSMIAALLQARARNVDVRLVLDGKILKSNSSEKIVNELKNAGVVVIASSPEFSITHAKAMVIDDHRVLVMSLNLTTLYEKTRDYAIETEDPAQVAEFLRVFDADVANAEARTKNTPALSCPTLLWSPVNAEAKLVALLDSAKVSIIASSENLGDPPIDHALEAAAARGVKTRVLAPLCDMNPNALFNVPMAREMDADKIDARLMPGPSSRDLPYIHAKMILVDGVRGYIGSVNFSENSTRHARELGILFDDRAAIAAITGAFEADFAKAAPPPVDTDGVCGHRSESAEP